MIIAVGIANFFAADIPASTSIATFAAAGEATSSNSAPSAASVACEW